MSNENPFKPIGSEAEPKLVAPTKRRPRVRRSRWTRGDGFTPQDGTPNYANTYGPFDQVVPRKPAR